MLQRFRPGRIGQASPFSPSLGGERVSESHSSPSSLNLDFFSSDDNPSISRVLLQRHLPQNIFADELRLQVRRWVQKTAERKSTARTCNHFFRLLNSRFFLLTPSSCHFFPSMTINRIQDVSKESPQRRHFTPLSSNPHNIARWLVISISEGRTLQLECMSSAVGRHRKRDQSSPAPGASLFPPFLQNLTRHLFLRLTSFSFLWSLRAFASWTRPQHSHQLREKEPGIRRTQSDDTLESPPGRT